MLIKSFITLIAIALTIAAYIPYIRDTLKGKTNPHAYSWFIWGFTGLIILALQIAGGAGFGSLVTVGSVSVTFAVFFLSLRSNDKNITRTDTFFFVMALLATVVWLVADAPVLSAVLLVSINVLGAVPTYRKSWNKPNEETLLTWIINSMRYALGGVAVAKYNVLTLLHPIVGTLLCGTMALVLVFRRRKLNRTKI